MTNQVGSGFAAVGDVGTISVRTAGTSGRAFLPFLNYISHAYIHRHGPISACPVVATTGFIRQYMDLPDGAREKLAIERQFGKNNVAKMVARYKEDLETKAWMDASTMACPRCEVVVEKSAGCNHVMSLLLPLLSSTDLASRSVTSPFIQMTCTRCT